MSWENWVAKHDAEPPVFYLKGIEMKSIGNTVERARIGIPGDVDYELARRPTKHKPGSEEKIRILELRAEFGIEPMHFDADCRDMEGQVGCAKRQNEVPPRRAEDDGIRHVHSDFDLEDYGD